MPSKENKSGSTEEREEGLEFRIRLADGHVFIIHSSCSGDEAEESDGLGGVETDEADFKAQVQPGLIIPPHFMSMNKAFLLVQWPPPQIWL